MPPALSAESEWIWFARSWADFNPRPPVSHVPSRNLRTGLTKSWVAFDLAPSAPAVLVRDLWALIWQPAALAYLLICLVLPMIAVYGMWGLPLGRTVHLSVDGHTVTFNSFQQTVGQVLASHKIALRKGDRVTPELVTRVWPGVQISVLRAVPATLTVGGTARSIRVAATTVGDALQTLGVTVGALDRVYPDPSSAFAPGIRITVERRELRAWAERTEVPFTSQVVNDESLFKGNRLVRSSGQPGLKERTVRVLYADGRPVSVTPLAWAVVKTPVPRIIANGTRAMTASRGAFAGREFMVMEATAYYPGPNNYGGGVGPRTAIGMLAQRGVVAVDPSVIPLRSRLYVEGYGYAVAGDTGGAIQGMRIDLCYNTYDEAIQFGRRPVTVYILGNR